MKQTRPKTEDTPLTLRYVLKTFYWAIARSEHDCFPIEKARGKFTKKMIRALLNHPVIEKTEKLYISGTPHLVHVYLVVGSDAIMFLGVDDNLLRTPFLCRDGDSFSCELLEWFLNAGLVPEGAVPLPEDPILNADEFYSFARVSEKAILNNPLLNDITLMIKRLEAAASSKAPHSHGAK